MEQFTRTKATLEYRTDLICKFAVDGIPHEFCLVALKKRRLKKHYILFFTNEIAGKEIYQDVKIVAEISLRANKLHFNIGISQSYPELAEFEEAVEKIVNTILAEKILELATA